MIAPSAPALTRADCAHAISGHAYVPPAELLRATSVPGVQRWEIAAGDATLALDDARLAAAVGRIVGG